MINTNTRNYLKKEIDKFIKTGNCDKQVYDLLFSFQEYIVYSLENNK